MGNTGNLVPSYGTTVGSSMATIDQAVGVRDIRNIIVCGRLCSVKQNDQACEGFIN
jgi:carbonic anhydrase